MIDLGIFLTACALAYVNGANDNYKGVASLYASGEIGHRAALGLGTGATLIGSLASVFLAQGLIATFSGKGIVPPEIVGGEVFLLSTAVGATTTVLLATLLGFPISTTHALVGGIIGAGAVASCARLSSSGIVSGFLVPLIASPFISLVAAASLFWTVRQSRRWRRQGPTEGAWARRSFEVSEGSAVIRGLHIASAGVVSFARGLNDTPKVAALLVAMDIVSVPVSLVLVGAGMAVGGLLSSHRVAETLGERITSLDPVQGLCANLTTAVLVVGASRFGVPVSTTHVSVGALFGIGLTTGQADQRVIRDIVLAWLLTVPCSALVGAAVQVALG